MREEVAKSLRESAEDMQNTVWPSIADLCRGGVFHPVESVIDRGFITKLDMYSGIDGFQELPELGVMRGIACRVQYVKKAYPSFTLRYSRSTKARTEFEKRLYAILNEDDGYLYPHLTIQAYMTKHNGQLLSVGIAKTKQLYLYTQKYLNDFRRVTKKPNPEDGNEFLAVWWPPYKALGNPLRIGPRCKEGCK